MISTSKEIKQDVCSNSLSLLGVHLVIKQWFKQTLCFSYFNEMRLKKNNMSSE